MARSCCSNAAVVTVGIVFLFIFGTIILFICLKKPHDSNVQNPDLSSIKKWPSEPTSVNSRSAQTETSPELGVKQSSEDCNEVCLNDSMSTFIIKPDPLLLLVRVEYLDRPLCLCKEKMITFNETIRINIATAAVHPMEKLTEKNVSMPFYVSTARTTFLKLKEEIIRAYGIHDKITDDINMSSEPSNSSEPFQGILLSANSSSPLRLKFTYLMVNADFNSS